MSDEYDIVGYEQLLQKALDAAALCVRMFVEESDPRMQYFMSERLGILGSVVLRGLKPVLEDPTAGADLRFEAARVALVVGERDLAVDILIDEVRAGTKLSAAAASFLGRRNVQRALPYIQDALRVIDPADGDSLGGYLNAIEDLHGDLPSDVRARLLAGAAPWFVEDIKRNFPET